MDSDSELKKQRLDIIENLLKQHYQRVINQYKMNPEELNFMMQYWEQLVQGSIFEYTIEAVDNEMYLSIVNNEHSYQAKSYSNVYVAVSTIPVIELSEIRSYFDNGYLEFLNTLLVESGYSQGGINIAHWIICAEGKNWFAHLTYIPDRNLAGQKTISLIAQDLLNPVEKSQLGL